MPTSRIAIIRRLVATGRSMKMREGFTALRLGAAASSRRALCRRAGRRWARRRRACVAGLAGAALCVDGRREPRPALRQLAARPAWPDWREPGRRAKPRPSRAGLGLPRRRGGCGRTLSGAGLAVAAPMMLAGAAGGPGRGSHSALLKPLTASSLRPGGRRVVDDLHLDAVAQTIDAVDHHLVARLQARGDHGVLAVGRSDDDVALGDRRIVVEEIDEIARRAELDRRDWARASRRSWCRPEGGH